METKQERILINLSDELWITVKGCVVDIGRMVLEAKQNDMPFIIVEKVNINRENSVEYIMINNILSWGEAE